MLRTVFAMMCFVAVSAAPTFKPNSNLDEHLSSLSHTITKTQTVCTDKKGAGWCATKMTADKCKKGSGQKNCMVHCGVCSSEGATPPAPAAATVVPTWELPEPPAGTITRKNVLKMDEDEQSRFAYSVLKMVENGDFFEAAKLHAATGEYCPHGGQEHFAYWHRLHILSFEEKLRAAHTALYGNDDIGVPYWAWDELETNMILPAKMREIFDAEGLSTADKFQSLDGRAFSTMKKEGFETPSDESIYADSDIIGSAINGAIKALKGAPNAKDHHKTQKGLEGPHGSVHRVAGYPMTKLEISCARPTPSKSLFPKAPPPRDKSTPQNPRPVGAQNLYYPQPPMPALAHTAVFPADTRPPPRSPPSAQPSRSCSTSTTAASTGSGRESRARRASSSSSRTRRRTLRTSPRSARCRVTRGRRPCSATCTTACQRPATPSSRRR